MDDRDLKDAHRILTPRERRQRNREEMRTAILTAALEIMRQDGVGALNLHELARRMGFRTSALYVYFSSKLAIYDALYAMGVQIYRREIQEALQTLTDPWEILKTVLERYMAVAIRNPELFQIVFERPIPGFVPSEASLAEWNKMTAEMFMLLNRVMPADAYDSDRNIAPAHGLMLAMMHGLTALHMANDANLPVGKGRFGSLVPAAVALFKTAWNQSASQPFLPSDQEN